MYYPYLYVPYAEPPPPPPPEWTSEGTAFVIALILFGLQMLIIAIAKYREPRKPSYEKRKVEFMERPSTVPAEVLQSKEAMAEWIRNYLNIEPMPYHIDMLMALKEARVNAAQRARLQGKFDEGYKIMMKKDIK